MKNLTLLLMSAIVLMDRADTWTDPETGIEWTFTVTNETASVGGDKATAIPKSTIGDVTIPPILDIYPVIDIGSEAFRGCSGLTRIVMPVGVTNIGEYAFMGCSGLTNVTIAEGVTSIGNHAFGNCSGLTNVVIAEGVTSIGVQAFYNCKSLASVTIPSSVKSIWGGAFERCFLLSDVYIQGCSLDVWDNSFELCHSDLIFHVPSAWNRRGKTLCGYTVVKDGEEIGTQTVNLTVTNIVVHYIQTSEMSSMTAPITNGVGLVNVITEIKGGNVAIPETWVSNYPTFKTKFGNDFSAALTKTTGKKDAAGNPMCVWQDYVAGTDPTDETSVFKASVTMVDGKPVVSYTPELTAEEKAKRKYTTWGKVKLQDEKWVEVPSGSEGDYNFFKVTVEMK